MAKNAAKSASKSRSSPGSGGKRAGAGRKPKAVTAMRQQVVAARNQDPGQDAVEATARQKSAAEFALDLFEATMRDAGKSLELRLDCAREVMNRTLGKPRVAEAPKTDQADGEQVHIFMPDNGRDARSG